MTSFGYVRLTLDLEAAARPVAGRLHVAGQSDRSFSGWLQLLAALEEAVENLHAPVAGSGEGGAR